jgi:hypothetical protein
MRPGEDDAGVGYGTNGGFLCTIGWQCNQSDYVLISPVFNEISAPYTPTLFLRGGGGLL